MLICQLWMQVFNYEPFKLIRQPQTRHMSLPQNAWFFYIYRELTLRCKGVNYLKSFSQLCTWVFFTQNAQNIHEYRRTRLQPFTDRCTITNIILPTWQTHLFSSLCGRHLLWYSSKHTPQEGYELRVKIQRSPSFPLAAGAVRLFWDEFDWPRIEKQSPKCQ